MYPRGEVREAVQAARVAGLDVSDNLHPHDMVRLLERHGYLPRDRRRVYALAEAARVQASERVRARRAVPEQLVLPWDGRLPRPEPVQVALF